MTLLLRLSIITRNVNRQALRVQGPTGQKAACGGCGGIGVGG